MSALAQVIIQVTQAVVAGDPLALQAFNAFGAAFGLELNLNFDAAPVLPLKEAALSGSDQGSNSGTGAAISKALLTVLVPAAVSAIEPYWFKVDADSPVLFGSCQLSGSATGSSSSGTLHSSSSASQDSFGGQTRQWNCPQGNTGGQRDGTIPGGEDGRENGNGNDGNQPAPPTVSGKSSRPDTTAIPRPSPGSTPPPPPPPPPPGLVGLSGNNRDAQKNSPVWIVFLVGAILAALFSMAARSFGDILRRTRRSRYRQSASASPGRTFSSSVPISSDLVVHPLANKVIIDEFQTQQAPVLPHTVEPTFGEDVVNVLIPQTSGKAIPSARDYELGGLSKVSDSFAYRLFYPVYAMLTMGGMMKMFWAMVIGLFVYYHMLIQAVGIVHLGNGAETEQMVEPMLLLMPADISVAQKDIFSEDEIVEAVVSVVDEVSTIVDADISPEDGKVEGIYASMHCPFRLGEDTAASVSSALPVKPVEHQGGVPVTELEFRKGYRQRRVTRCRKKKGTTVSETSAPLVALTAVVESKSKPSTKVKGEDEDSRGLSSSMWAS